MTFSTRAPKDAGPLGVGAPYLDPAKPVNNNNRVYEITRLTSCLARCPSVRRRTSSGSALRRSLSGQEPATNREPGIDFLTPYWMIRYYSEVAPPASTPMPDFAGPAFL